MDKQILNDYIDACELIRETERDIKRLKKRREEVLQDSVRGSNPEFPYNPQSFKIHGTAYTCRDDNRLRTEEELLVERKNSADRIRRDVEVWMLTIPARMQRIIRYRFFEGLSWAETAARMGRKATGDSVRMEFANFLK
ncbi:MAG: RNA polymerase subunit sigma-70 [Eubacteriales bacterium]|nr:RNA polymerase subunit sigma-70 [Eubacteriales bacterium]